ncbi:unnamed protein product, partial [Leptidea sinapis]
SVESPQQQPPQSPRSVRKRFGSASEETILKRLMYEILSASRLDFSSTDNVLFYIQTQQVNGNGSDGGCITAGEWEAFKLELMKEVKSQFAIMKREIIDAMKTEFSRR